MRSYCPDRVGGSRLWNDQYIREQALNAKVLYSIHDHCPGMPVDLEEEYEARNLHPFVHNGIVTHPLSPTDKYPPLNPEGPVNKMVQREILKDSQVHTIQNFLAELNQTCKSFEDLEETWPFEIARYVIALHLQRLRMIDRVLNLYIEQVTQQLAQKALAQSGGQHSAPNRNAQEQLGPDAGRDGGNQ
jgi:hypothetical protein